MYRKEINQQSPLRILDQCIHGGLGKGNLGVVMARAGVGKTACLVQIGLDDLMRDRGVLHIALGQTVEHVQAWYDALFDDLAALTALEDKEAVRAGVARHRLIQAYADHTLPSGRVERVVDLFSKHVHFKPDAIVIDGYDWEGPPATTGATIGALKSFAKRLNAELWMSAQTHREQTGPHPTVVPPPCAQYVEMIDVALFLEPSGSHVDLRLLKDHNEALKSDPPLKLECDTLRLVTEGSAPGKSRLPTSAYTLLSGAANGAEEAFGACAEKWGLGEVNYTFAGHEVARTRGLHTLSDAELLQGDVSSAYLKAHMHRSYPGTAMFKKVLQSIWHQVNTAGEVFVVGTILEDGTVKGGTGWAAELAKHHEQPIHVFDQEKRSWFTWTAGQWTAEEAPVVTRSRFTGTGTRFLSPDGKAAIEGLFARSFGPR